MSIAEEKKYEPLLDHDKEISITKCIVLTNKQVGQLKQEVKSPMKYTSDIHPGSSSFLKMFNSGRDFKKEKIKEDIIGSTIHPAYR